MVLPKKRKAEPLEKNAVGESNTFVIDLDNFQKRLKKFYAYWWKHQMDFWSGCDIVAVAVSPSSDTKSSAFSLWLFGYQVTHLIMIFLEKHIHFLCAEEKTSLPDTLKMAAMKAVNVELTIHLKAESDDGTGLIDRMLQIIEDQCKSNGCEHPAGGFLLEETPEGKLLEILAEKWKKKFQLRDIADEFSELLLVKDGTQLMNVRKAASLVSYVMEHFVAQECKAISQRHCPLLSHWNLVDSMEQFIFNLEKKIDVKPENIELCHRPIFQRGYGFNLDDLSLEKYDWDLCSIDTGVIISAIGLRYKGYCANIARTYLICPHPVQLKAFEVLLKAQKAAIDALKPGNKVSAAYQAAVSMVQREAPELAACLTNSAGAGIGLEFSEAGLRLDFSNDQVLKPGMVFNVSLGFENVHAETKNPMTEKFSLLLADTVVVNEVAAENLTVVMMKGEVSYIFRDTQRDLPAYRLRNYNQDTSNHSDVVAASGGAKDVAEASDVRESQELSPPVQIKKELNAVLVPMSQSIVPFHLSLIKGAYHDEIANRDSVTVMFNPPVTESTPYLPNSMQGKSSSCYLEEITFPAGDESSAKKFVQEINALQQQFSLRELKKAKPPSYLGRTDLMADHLDGFSALGIEMVKADQKSFKIGRNSGFYQVLPPNAEVIHEMVRQQIHEIEHAMTRRITRRR